MKMDLITLAVVCMAVGCKLCGSGNFHEVNEDQALKVARKYLKENYKEHYPHYTPGEVIDSSKPNNWAVPFWGDGGPHDLVGIFVEKKTGRVSLLTHSYWLTNNVNIRPKR